MAAAVGGVTGALVLGGFIALGLLLDDRVASIVPVIVLARPARTPGGWSV